MLGVFIWDEYMLFNHAHHGVDIQHVQFIQDQCTLYNKKCFYIGWLLLSVVYLTLKDKHLLTLCKIWTKDEITFN